MIPATAPRPVQDQRLLCIDPSSRTFVDRAFVDLPAVLRSGDLLVVNDAFTLPASVRGRIRGVDIELRLVGPIEEGWVVLFGPGDWRMPTETRPGPPPVGPGTAIDVHGVAVVVREVSELSARLVRLDLPASLIWQHGRPVQYSYLERDLTLAQVQTPYANRPWATEMPSAGRPLTAGVLGGLKEAGISVATVTHAAGLSSTGDPTLDAALPLAERYEVPPITWSAVQQADRVVAVGTSTVRALESAARGPLRGITELRIEPDTRLQVVGGLLSGMHEPGESHFAMMGAFADRDLLLAAHAHASRQRYRNHELGDSTLILPSSPVQQIV